MKPYQLYPSEKRTFKDPVSGATVHQMTNYLGHSVHPYFTDNGWYDDGRKFIFESDRGGVRNLFSCDVQSGQIAQLTDFSDPRQKPAEQVKHICAQRNETYYWQNNCLYGLDLKTLGTRPIFIANIPGHTVSGGVTGADGKYYYLHCDEDLSARIYTNLSASYIGFEETFRAKPHCMILRIDLDSGKSEVIREENCWIGHVNPSPTQQNILTFCHEGPWDLVDNRMWVLDTDTGKVQPLRPREKDGEMIGHEYWLQDGLHVAYQVHVPNEGDPVRTTYTGFIRYDGTDRIEAKNGPMRSPDHVHSLDTNLIVCDAGKSIHLIRRQGETFDRPRVLAMHHSSFYHQNSHPHPGFTPDGKGVLYASDVSGYINIYLAEIPDYDTLPYLYE